SVFPLWVGRKYLPGRPWPWPGTRRLVVEVLWSLPLFLGMWVVIVIVMALWSLVPAEAPSNFMADAPGLSWQYVLMLLTACTLGPLAEEIFCRGFLYNGLRRYMPGVAAAVVQAGLFGLFHTYNLGYVVVTFFIGLYLAAVYQWRQTLVTPLCLHVLQN